MPTRTATLAANGYRVVLTVSSGRAVYSDDDVAEAAKLVAEWLWHVHPEVTTATLLEMREEYLAVAERGARPENTSYGLITAAAADVAERAFTRRWVTPARVLAVVDIVP